MTALTRLDADNYQQFVYGHEHVVLLLVNDAALFPESGDLAVILPELLKRWDGALHGALIDRAIERELQAQFRFSTWPSLVFLRRGGYLGAISGLRDWQEYLAEFERILALPVGTPPAFDLAQACAGHA